MGSDGVEQFTAVPNIFDAYIFQILQLFELGRSASSIEFSRNASSYCSRPRLSSQS